MENLKRKSDKLLSELLEFSKLNEKILMDWKELVKKTDKQLFRDYCYKKYLKNCEPMYCTYRITNSCEYPKKRKKLELG